MVTVVSEYHLTQCRGGEPQVLHCSTDHDNFSSGLTGSGHSSLPGLSPGCQCRMVEIRLKQVTLDSDTASET